MKKIIKRNQKRLILWSFLLFILGVTVAFFWNEMEQFSLGSPINDDKIANYFTSIGAIGGLLTLILLYMQLKEMQNQSVQQNLPDLYPLMTILKDIHAPSPVGGLPSHYFRNVENGEEVQKERLFIRVQNIGNGAAKNIGINWKYNLDDIEKFIDGQYHTLKPKETETDHLDVVGMQAQLKIRPPFYYLECCGKLLNPDSVKYFIDDDVKKKPELTLSLTYSSISNRTFNATYNVFVEAFDDRVVLKFFKIFSADLTNSLD